MGILTSGQADKQHIVRCLLLVAILVQLCACAAPVQQFDNLARKANFTKIIMTGNAFEHVLYSKHGRSDAHTTLHVYIEGDGQPWLTPRRIALNPTSHDPLMLQLMTMDNGPALYLGRPCYIGLADSFNCHPWYWTTARYSRKVVDSMQSALRQYLYDKPFSRLVFFGHSGGGSLAMLLAMRFSQTSTLLTIAGNIDTVEWTRYHAYSPLNGLNPVNSLPLQVHIKQIHLMGEDDVNVPPALTIKALENQQNTQLIVIPGYSHKCCWKKIWGEVLRCIQDAGEHCMLAIKPGLS